MNDEAGLVIIIILLAIFILLFEFSYIRKYLAIRNLMGMVDHRILNSVSRLIELDHPFVLDLRWRFHKSLRGDGWSDYDKWKENIIAPNSSNKYNLSRFLPLLNENEAFRKSVIWFLKEEVKKLEDKQ